MKIRLFEAGTLYSKGNHHKFCIPRNKVLASTKEELKDLFEDHPGYLPLSDVEFKEQVAELHYDVPDGYLSFDTLKKNPTLLKLKLLHTLLQSDVLEDKETYLNPSNLYYEDTNTVKSMYRANRFLPKAEVSHLDQYKALILSLFCKYSFEKCLRDSYTILQSLDDEFLYYVFNCKTTEEMKEIIKNRLAKDETAYFHEVGTPKRNRTESGRKWLAIGVCALLCVSSVGLAAASHKKTESLQVNYADELTQKNQELKTLEVSKAAFNNNQQSMKSVGYALLKQGDISGAELVNQTLKDTKLQLAILQAQYTQVSANKSLKPKDKKSQLQSIQNQINRLKK